MDRERDYIIIKYKQFGNNLYSHIYLIKNDKGEYLLVDLWGRSNIFRKIMSRKILKRVAKDGCSPTTLPNILTHPLYKGDNLKYFHYGDETERVIGWIKKKMKV